MQKNKLIIFAVFCSGVLALAGCESIDSGTKKGAGLGALAGAAIGGIVGHQDGHGWEGALIGGAAGATAGGVIGHQVGKDDAGTPSSGDEYLTVVEIVDLAKNGTPDDVIISEIDRTQSIYELSAETIDYLKNNGVSNAVVDHMLATSP
jgi:uncharacterized protein YcfJ